MAKSANRTSGKGRSEENPVSAPRPVIPRVEPITELLGASEIVRNRCISESDPEKVQACIKHLDDILKDIAQVQQRIGTYRKEVGLHLSSLRQAHPKGKPEEGKVRSLPDGRQVIYLDGSWSPYSAFSGDEGPKTVLGE
jgi:hypothetical protein